MPSDPEAVVFGIQVDKHDPNKGWLPLKIPENEDGNPKGKGIKKDSVLNESPLGAGLKDSQMLAFKFQDSGEQRDADDDWDVVMPSYEDDASSQTKS